MFTFADQPDCLAAAERQRHTVDRPHLGLPARDHPAKHRKADL
jgi:hypothetical protein